MKLKQPILFAAGREIALNADATSLPEWIQIAPFGEFPTRDKSKIQVFNAAAAAEMIAWFNFWPRRMARLAHVNCIKVYVGHPDLAPGEWPERIDLGSVMELADDEHGLNARVNWNAGSLEHAKLHKFPSGAWDTDDIDAIHIKPVMLLSVGMWHKPNIKSVQSVINAVPDDETNPETEPEPETTPPTLMNKIKELLIKLGLLKAEAADTELEPAIETLGTEFEAMKQKLVDMDAAKVTTEADVTAKTAEINALTSTLATRNQELETLRTSQVNATIERLIETGRVSKAEEDDTRAQLNANFDEAHARLLKRGIQLNSTPVKIIATRTALASAQDRTAQINAWTDAYMTKEKVSYNDAFAACQRDDKMKPLFEAMKQAE